MSLEDSLFCIITNVFLWNQSTIIPLLFAPSNKSRKLRYGYPQIQL